MARTVRSPEGSKLGLPFTEQDDTTASLGEALTAISTIDVKFAERVYIEVAVTSQALDQFTVNCRSHRSGSYEAMKTTAGDYTSPSGIVVRASGDLTTISAGSSGYLLLDVRGIENVQIKAASGNAAGSGVTVYSGQN